MDLRWEILSGYGPLFMAGLWTTVQLTLVSIVCGMVLGVVLGLISSSPSSASATATILSAHAPLHPSARALATTQDRLAEKRCFERLGIPTAPFAGGELRC